MISNLSKRKAEKNIQSLIDYLLAAELILSSNMLLHTGSVFLLVFGLWKSVQSYSLFEEKYKNLNDKNEILKYNLKMKSPPDRKEINYPIVINTWPFVNATAKAWDVLIKTDSRLDAGK